MKKTLLAFLVVSLVIVVGCTPPPAPPKPASITKAEGETLLKPVFAAADGGWRQADRSKVESATLAAFALKDAFARDVEPFANTLGELDLKHTLGTEPREMEMRLDGLGGRMVQGLPETLKAIKAKDDAGLFAIAWSFDEEAMGVEGGPDYTPDMEALSYLMSEYLAPARAASLDAIEYAVEPSNTVVVSYRYAAARTPETTAGTVWEVKYLTEKRDGGWKVVGLADAAGMLNQRDEAAVAFYADKEKRRKEAEGSLPSDAEIVERNGGERVLWKGVDDQGRYWAALGFVYEMPRPTGPPKRQEFAFMAYRDASGKWHHSEAGAGDGRVQVDRNFPVPEEVINAMVDAGVKVNEQD